MKHTLIKTSNKMKIKKYLFIILIFVLLFSLCYLSKIRNRNSKREGFSYPLTKFIQDFQVVTGIIKDVNNAKNNAEFSLLPAEDRYSAERDKADEDDDL